MESQKSVRVVRWEAGLAPPTQEEAEAKLHHEGYDAICWHDVPGTAYPRHRHEHDECLWVIRGEITFTIESVDHTLRPGDRLYLPAHTPHTARVPRSQSVTYLIGQKGDRS